VSLTERHARSTQRIVLTLSSASGDGAALSTHSFEINEADPERIRSEIADQIVCVLSKDRGTDMPALDKAAGLEAEGESKLSCEDAEHQAANDDSTGSDSTEKTNVEVDQQPVSAFSFLFCHAF
jgi:hypothetical protein